MDPDSFIEKWHLSEVPMRVMALLLSGEKLGLQTPIVVAVWVMRVSFVQFLTKSLLKNQV